MAYFRCGGQSATGNATASDVKSGKTFSNANGTDLVGTFEAQEKTVTAGTSAASVTPDSGKYLSKVTYNPTPSQEKTITASRSKQTVTPDTGYLLSKVTVNKYPDASGTYSATARGNALDMGATNNLRYVDTTGVPNSNSGTYSVVDADFGTTKDLGATNTYRYISVPAKPSVSLEILILTASANLIMENTAIKTYKVDKYCKHCPTKGGAEQDAYANVVYTCNNGYVNILTVGVSTTLTLNMG